MIGTQRAQARLRAPRGSMVASGGSFVVTNTSSRGTSLSARAWPISASLPYIVPCRCGGSPRRAPPAPRHALVAQERVRPQADDRHGDATAGQGHPLRDRSCSPRPPSAQRRVSAARRSASRCWSGQRAPGDVSRPVPRTRRTLIAMAPAPASRHRASWSGSRSADRGAPRSDPRGRARRDHDRRRPPPPAPRATPVRGRGRAGPSASAAIRQRAARPAPVWVGAAPDPDRDRFGWPRRDAGGVDHLRRAGMDDARLGPEPAQERDLLVDPCRTAPEVDPEGLVLHVVPPDAHPETDAARARGGRAWRPASPRAQSGAAATPGRRSRTRARTPAR